MHKNNYLNIFLIVIILSISGCSQYFKGYGKTRILSGAKGEVTIQDLIENWDDYDIYYAGLDARSPLGVMFDPKNNDSSLKGDRWKKIINQKELLETIKWLCTTADNHQPDLRIILGPDAQFFGYMYHSHGYIVLKKIDEKTMYVNDLQGSIWEDAIYMR